MILTYFCLKLAFILVCMDLVDSQTSAPSWSLDEIDTQECGKTHMAFGRTYYGKETRHGEYPWNAVMIHKDPAIGFFCGGTLVSKKLVITAAHCIEGKGGQYFFKPGDIVVMLGAHNISNPLEDGKITTIVKDTHIHHDWNPDGDSFDADIAILELSRPVYFDQYIQPICLAEPGTVAASINIGYVVGFGKSERANKEDVARIVKTPIYSYRVCGTNSQIHQQLVSNRGICGGYANGTGICTGDGGSGLIVVYEGTYYLRGIVSASLGGGIEGCNLHKYSIFTDILEFFGWITTGKDDKILVRELLIRIKQLEANISSLQVTSSTINCGTRGGSVKGLIYGGTLTDIGEYPWNVALIRSTGDFFCGGTLVSDRHIVTAAHCIEGKYGSHMFGTEDFTVMLGVHNHKRPVELGRVSAKVKSIYIHKYWSTDVPSYDGDIAILELANEVQFSNYIRPICFVDDESEVAEISHGTVVGFGLTENGQISDIANKLDISIRDYHSCTKTSSDHQTFASARTFCGGPADGRGVCTGDSGGGVYVLYNDQFYLRGLVSSALFNNNSECDTHKQAVFTDVTQYYDFIKRGGKMKKKQSRSKRFLFI